MTALYELYDSDNPLAIPVGVKAAGYDDGYAATAWATYGWSRFPDALHITVFGLASSDVGDVETGDLDPASGARWAATRKSMGKVAIVYVNRANGHLVEAALRSVGVAPGEALLWIATDDGTQVVTVWDDGSPVTYPVFAVQYLNEAHGSGGHYDRSLVYIAFSAGGGTIGGDKLNLNEKRGFVRLAYLAALGRQPETPQVMDGYANAILDDASNLDTILVSITDSAEGLAYRANVQKAIADVDTPGQPDDDSAFATKAYVDAGDAAVRAAIPTKATTTLG